MKVRSIQAGDYCSITSLNREDVAIVSPHVTLDSFDNQDDNDDIY